jgi:hypothetical protein
MRGSASISNNTAAKGGGEVLVYKALSFTKKGGIIYGDTDAVHTPGSVENTAADNNGHAVWLDGGQKRNSDAGTEVNLYAGYNAAAGSWNIIDSSPGSVGIPRGTGMPLPLCRGPPGRAKIFALPWILHPASWLTLPRQNISAA